MATDLKYPIGKFQWEDGLSEARRREMIEQIAETPAKVRAAVAGLSETQLDTPYRDGGWTVRPNLRWNTWRRSRRLRSCSNCWPG